MSKKEIRKIKKSMYEKVEQLKDETLLQMVEEALTAYGNTIKRYNWWIFPNSNIGYMNP